MKIIMLSVALLGVGAGSVSAGAQALGDVFSEEKEEKSGVPQEESLTEASGQDDSDEQDGADEDPDEGGVVSDDDEDEADPMELDE